MKNEQLNDKWLRLGGIVILNLFLNIFFYIQLMQEKSLSFWKIFWLSTLFVIASWELTRYVVLQVRKRFPGLQNTRRRLFHLTAFVTLATAALSVLKVLFIDFVNYYGEMSPNVFEFLYTFGMNMFYAMIITGIYESIYFFHQWRRMVKETEQLKKENLQSQFDSLKSQVNPHFLFNSLNSLSSLVEEDKDKAVRFISELSEVYRYLLQSNERELAPLSSELEFLKAYFFLLQTRFDKGVELEIDVNPVFHAYLIPPLTLQMLVENAVKHNVVSASRPLHIRILNDPQGRLHVVNNLQPKSVQVPSGKLGLANIAAKFRLLRQPELEILKTETTFEVILPLMDHQRLSGSFSRADLMNESPNA